jgi:hypothetical protein
MVDLPIVPNTTFVLPRTEAVPMTLSFPPGSFGNSTTLSLNITSTSPKTLPPLVQTLVEPSTNTTNTSNATAPVTRTVKLEPVSDLVTLQFPPEIVFVEDIQVELPVDQTTISNPTRRRLLQTNADVRLFAYSPVLQSWVVLREPTYDGAVVRGKVPANFMPVVQNQPTISAFVVRTTTIAPQPADIPAASIQPISPDVLVQKATEAAVPTRNPMNTVLLWVGIGLMSLSLVLLLLWIYMRSSIPSKASRPRASPIPPASAPQTKGPLRVQSQPAIYPVNGNNSIVKMAGRHVSIDIHHTGHGNGGMTNTHNSGVIPVFSTNAFSAQRVHAMSPQPVAQYPHHQTATHAAFSHVAAQGMQLSLRGGHSRHQSHYGSEV